MNLFRNKIFVVAALCFFLPYVLADDDEDDDDVVAVRTLLLAPNSVPASVLQDIDEGMDLITDPDDRRLSQSPDEVDAMEPHSRQLRFHEEDRKLSCSMCLYYPAHYKGCWVKYRWTPKCRARQLIVHRTLTDETIAKLDEKELRRYLQTSTACQEAIDDMEDDIDDAIVDGIVPTLPSGASFVEECIFEEIDD